MNLPASSLPPGPELPPSRQTARWVARPVSFMRWAQRSFGDVFTLRLLGEPAWVMVSDPALVKQVFTAPSDVLRAGHEKRILEPVLGAGSVLLADGAAHVRQRRLLLPAFEPNRVAGFEAAMRAAAESELDRWPTGVAGAAGGHLAAIALEVVLRATFGPVGNRQAPLREAIERLMEYLAEPRRALVALADRERFGTERFAELRQLIARADELVYAEISARRHGDPDGSYDDVLSLLLGASHEDGSPLADAELRDELMTLVVAGHETTATSLAWALERLVHRPEALRAASREAIEGGERYVNAVVLETLRLRSPFMVVPRLAVEPFRLGALEIPPGVAITPAIPLVHRRADVYPDPESFRPERFLDARPGTYSWIPFGGGVRRCIGAGFAMLEMRVVLSALLRRAELRAAGEEPELEARRLLVMAPSRGARVVLAPR